MTAEKQTNAQTAPSMFTQMVMMLATSALQQMGKIVNPITKKSEVSMEGAQASIDLLDMLAEKTKGNLDDEESKMLADTLASLKMTFVETRKEGSAPPPTEQPRGEETPKQEQEPPANGDSDEVVKDASQGETKEPKYHKTYE